MLFIEFRFFLFFAIVFCVYWSLRNNTARKAWILICSHLFYACFFIGNPGEFLTNVGAGAWDKLPKGWWFPFVLMASTCMDYIAGLGAADSSSRGGKRAWLLLSLIANLGTLCIFKYFNFFVSSASTFLEWFGLPTSEWTLKLLLPYGISFYTFQSMSYTIEVYRGHIQAERKFLDLAFFIAFFPQLVAGPIVRALTFLPQTKSLRSFATDVDVRGALVQFLVGFVKKACVAESVAPFVDQYFQAPGKFTAISAWIAVLLYAVQIYCDFSGYTDMAIATARLIGYKLTINFDYPYFSRNVTEFWRRWHISLSTWLRDYLYISLGGNRGSTLFTYRNLFLTMALGGLWHGASWNFIIWGALHGAALIVHREWKRLAQAWTRPMTWWQMNAASLFSTALTFYFVCCCWIFFRAANLDQARTVWRAFGRFKSRGLETLDYRLIWLFIALAVIHWLNSRGIFRTWWRRGSDYAFAAGYGCAIALILPFIPQHYTPFIYFQF
jgi:alginate O-acetyltransferase complex protein AlgI